MALNFDADADGLSDTRERANWLNYLSASAAVTDSDFDNVINRMEFLGLTDPHNASAFLRTGAVVRPGANLFLDFHGLSTQQRYQLKCITDADFRLGQCPRAIRPGWFERNVLFTPLIPKRYYRLRVDYTF